MLISAFDHLSAYDFGRDLLIDEIQVSCYKIIESLYTLGTNLGLSRSKKFLRMEINANRARDNPIQHCPSNRSIRIGIQLGRKLSQKQICRRSVVNLE